MTLFTLTGVVNIIIIVTGNLTYISLILVFLPSVMFLELIHWVFSWQYYKSSIDIQILLGVKTGNVQKNVKKYNRINTLVIGCIVLVILVELIYFICTYYK